MGDLPESTPRNRLMESMIPSHSSQGHLIYKKNQKIYCFIVERIFQKKITSVSISERDECHMTHTISWSASKAESRNIKFDTHHESPSIFSVCFVVVVVVVCCSPPSPSSCSEVVKIKLFDLRVYSSVEMLHAFPICDELLSRLNYSRTQRSTTSV